MALSPPGALRRRLSRLEGWLRESVFRKVFASTVALALVLASSVSVTGYFAARRVIRQSVLAELAARAELVASELELTVGGVIDNARALSRNSIVTSALVDSEGVALHLVPLLADFASIAP